MTSTTTSTTPTRPAADLEVIIPAYNEAARIPATLERTVAFLAAQPWDARIVVVDNGSVDDTAGVVRAVAARLDPSVPIEVIGCTRPGKGAAVRRGLATSSARVVGFFDADLSTPVETLTAAMFHLATGAGAVIASRHAPGASFAEPQPLGRRLGGAAFRALSRSVVPGVHDSQCGFKFFTREVAAAAIRECRLDGFAFDVELLRRVQQTGASIVEVPVTWTDDARSTFHPIRDGIPSFRAVLSLRGA
ncbi:glycosyltransferase family 2 protein [Actinomycetospora chlora]|uniref:Glycosyltransferase family 2 protein n=1 Tax=Actinomycetospora chlora TaxID=663608 RepID=A0ABP9BMU3_9PSEU